MSKNLWTKDKSNFEFKFFIKQELSIREAVYSISKRIFRMPVAKPKF
jgi:hypothetical protein